MREWTIKGGLGLRERPGGPPGNYPMAFCDGPVPEINEHVRVIEYSAYESLTRALAFAADKLTLEQKEEMESIAKGEYR